MATEPTTAFAPPAPTAPHPAEVTPTPSGFRAGLGRFGWVARPVVIFVASRVVTVSTLAIAWPFTRHSILQEIDRWDSRWFLRAAANGWPRHLPYVHGHVTGNPIAFSPSTRCPSGGSPT
jgi:hypothetical protein